MSLKNHIIMYYNIKVMLPWQPFDVVRSNRHIKARAYNVISFIDP